MWCMWCTQLCIDQFLSLHSLVFQPHDILGHMICVCSIKIYSSRILPKKLIQVKMPQRDSLDSDLQTFCNFSTTESSLSSQTLVQWGVSCYSSVEQVHLIDALWGRRCLGRMACFGTLFWGLGQALLIWDLCKIATWPSKERQKLKKKKNVAPGGANDHPAIGTSRKEKNVSKGPRNPGELSQHAHAVGPHLQTLRIRVTTSSVNLSFGSHNVFSTQQYFCGELWGQHRLDAGHHPSVSQTLELWFRMRIRESHANPPLRVMILDACILIPNGNFINWTAASPVAPRHLSTSSTSQQDLRQPTPIRTILHRAAGWITASMASNWVIFCQLIQGKCGQNRTFKKLKMIWCGMMRSKSMVTGDSSVCLFLLFK